VLIVAGAGAVLALIFVVVGMLGGKSGARN
jgi:hypothetical protein